MAVVIEDVREDHLTQDPTFLPYVRHRLVRLVAGNGHRCLNIACVFRIYDSVESCEKKCRNKGFFVIIGESGLEAVIWRPKFSPVFLT